MATLILSGDYLTGPMILFPVFYLIPVMLISWYNGIKWGLFFAVAMPLVRVLFSLIWPVPWAMSVVAVNTVIRIFVLSIIAALVNVVATQKRALEKEIVALRGILPICSYCERIRDGNGNWQILEEYLMTNTEAKLSHSICPDCVQDHYPDLAVERNRESP